MSEESKCLGFGTKGPQGLDKLSDDDQIEHLGRLLNRLKKSDPDERFMHYVLNQIYCYRKSGTLEVSSGGTPVIGTPGIVPGWDEVTFAGRGIIFTPGNKNLQPDISLVLGGTLTDPLWIPMPLWGAPESLGSTSEIFHEAKLRASSQISIDNLVGIPAPRGEGGDSDYLDSVCRRLEKKYRPLVVKQYASGRFGVDLKYINGSYMIEIKLGQGAKPSEGGELPANKNKGIVPVLRHAKPYQKLKSPATQFYSVEALKELVRELRIATRGKAVIGIKLASCDVYQDVTSAAVALEGDGFIVVDGGEGSTGAAKTLKREEFRIPSILTIAPATEALKDLGELRGNIKLGVSGGYGRGHADAFKAIFAGADFVNYGSAEMIAGGCYRCNNCHLGNCSIGIATQDETGIGRYKGNLDYHIKNLIAFWEAQAAVFKEILRAYGMTDTGYFTDHIAGVRNPQPRHLVALTRSASEVLGIPYLSTDGPNLRKELKRLQASK